MSNKKNDLLPLVVASIILVIVIFSGGLLRDYTIGELFYELCSLDKTQNINSSIEKIMNLLKEDTYVYLPKITAEINKKIQEIYEIK